MSLKYDCWGYRNGKPEWNVTVIAENRSEAERKALDKFKSLGRNPDKITVK